MKFVFCDYETFKGLGTIEDLHIIFNLNSMADIGVKIPELLFRNVFPPNVTELLYQDPNIDQNVSASYNQIIARTLPAPVLYVLYFLYRGYDIFILIQNDLEDRNELTLSTELVLYMFNDLFGCNAGILLNPEDYDCMQNANINLNGLYKMDTLESAILQSLKLYQPILYDILVREAANYDPEFRK